MWDISNTTTWVTRQPHLQLRRELPAVVAPAGPGHRPPGQLRRLRRRVHRQPGRGLPARLLRLERRQRLPARAAFTAGPVGNPREFNFSYFAPYIQDDWKVSSKLTLNLGLRYDYRSVPYETNNRMAWRNLAYAPGGLLVADETLVPARASSTAPTTSSRGGAARRTPTEWKVFAPRLGFAYRPTDVGKHRRPGRLRDLLRLRRGTRDRRRRRRLSVREPRDQYSQTLGQTTPLLTTDQLFPSFTARRSGDARGQHVPRGEPVAGAEESARPPVVAGGAAADLETTTASS